MLSFRECERRFQTARPEHVFHGVRLRTNTYLIRLDDDTFAVRYYRDMVVLVHRDGTWTINTFGATHPAVIARISQFSPVALVRDIDGGLWADGTTYRTLYHDGMRVDSNGKPIVRSRVD